jgi:hypothetical protein
MSAAAWFASGAALAAPITTSAVPITQFFVMQPVDVCTDAGTGCAYINNSFQTVLSAPYACTANGVSTQCANILVDFIDPGTGMISLRNIFSAIGIDAKQTPVVQYNSTASQTLKVDSCMGSGTTDCMSSSLNTLLQQPGIANGAAPTFPRASSPLTINKFFVKNICSTANTTCTKGDLDGIGALNGNGSAIANLVFFPALAGRPDSGIHEGGHNFDLDHTTFGARGSTNLMTAGTARTVPGPTVTTTSKPSAAWVLEVSPNATPSTALDLLTMGTKGDGVSQQGQVLLSGFLQATPAALANLQQFSPEDASVQTAAAPSNSAQPIEIYTVVAFTDVADVDSNVSLGEMIVVFTQGKPDNSSGHSLTILQGGSMLAGPPTIGHGNNGNGACADQGPSTWCVDFQYTTGAFTPGFDHAFDFTIGTKPADVTQQQATVCYFWVRSNGTPYYNSCNDLVVNGFANSQNVNLALNPFFPINSAGTAGNLPCTTTTTCPPPTYTQDDASVEKSSPQSDPK